MSAISRRQFLRNISCGAAAAATAGLAVMPTTIEAMPLTIDKSLMDGTADFIEKAQVVVVHPRRRRRRRWVCWWHRGRRVCGWR